MQYSDRVREVYESAMEVIHGRVEDVLSVIVELRESVEDVEDMELRDKIEDLICKLEVRLDRIE